MPRSINTKLMLGQLLMALLGAVALAACGYVILYSFLMTSQREKAEYIAKSRGEQILQNFDQKLNLVERIAKSDAVEAYSRAFWEGALTLHLSREAADHRLPLVAYLNEHGLEQVKLLRGQKAVHFFDHGSSPLFKLAKSQPNKVFFKIITKADNDTDLLPPYIRFIYYSENLGDFAGAVMAMAPVSALAPGLSNFHFEKTGFVTLFNQDGVVLDHPDKGILLKTADLSVFPKLKNLTQGGATMFRRASVLGVDQYNAIVYLPKVGIFVNASLPRRQFLAIPNKLVFIYLAVIFLTLSLCLVVSFLLARGITRPILDLATVSNQLAKGDWTQEIDTSASDEIGVLAKSFQVMKHRLHDMIRSRDQEILAREKSERRYKTLFNAAPDAVSILDEGGNVTDINPACCELYGVSREEMLGQPSLDFIDRQNWETCQLNFRKLKNEQADVEEEITILHGNDKDKRPVWRKARTLVEEDGSFSGVLAYDRDIGGQKELEKLREDLERIARHDLKTPLNGVINIPYLIRRENNLSANQLRWLQMIEDSGYKMLDLINKSLDMYRMEAGTYDFIPIGVDLVALLKKIALDLAEQMQAKRLELLISLNGKPVSDDSSFLVPGDELLCYSMLANLVKNALEASPTAKTIEIFLENQDQYCVTIHNLGAVPSNLQDCFFSKYTTAGKKCGTGLGTYSAMLMAKTQRADISMRSSSEEGTFITVSFPKTA